MSKETRKVDICYVFSNGFGARMVLHSGVVSALRSKGLSVAVVAPNAGEDSLRKIADRDGISLERAPAVGGTLRNEYHRMRRYLFEDIRLNPAIWAQYLKSKANPPKKILKRLWRASYYPINRASVLSPSFRMVLSSVERRALANHEVADVLRRLQPSVAVATYPIDALDASLLFEAKRLGIHTVCHLMSWDNITSKGRFPVLADSYISWGPIMTGELQEYYQIAPERIHECGVAHFDVYTHSSRREGPFDALTSLGLDPAKPYLFFGLSASGRGEVEVVEWLAHSIRRNSFGLDMQLVVRLHPQESRHSGRAERLRAIAGDRVALDYPSLEESALRWNLMEGDLEWLAQLIAHSCLCLNSGSTVCIDAILLDKPVIVTAFDGHDDFPWWQSSRRMLDYVHFRKLRDLGGLRVVQSFEELGFAVEAYLRDPRLDAAGRAASRNAECGPCDGGASERIARALASIASCSKRERQATA